MNRRQSLKAIGITTLSAGILLNACKSDATDAVSKIPATNADDTETTGLEEFEKERLKKLKSEPAFFNEHERSTLIILADIIIPKDDVSGSASDAKVIDFIDFIVKDIPEHQIPLRGGLKWLDVQCLNRYEHSFSGSSSSQQLEMVTDIAYPTKAKPGMQQGVVFFTRLRSLVATGFYTSEIGIKDIGYVGNVPGQWTGVPADVLKQYNLTDVKI
jgi:hypothetical protein